MHLQHNTGKSSGSGINHEGTLHSQIKQWYALPGDRLELPVEGYIIDLVRENPGTGQRLLIEVQTANFGALGKKLRALIKHHQVRLVYPIAKEKWILRLSNTGEPVSRRRSPKVGSHFELFNELIRIPDLIREANFSLEILMANVEEIRCANGKGSWRRRRVSIVDRKLLEVVERVEFNSKEDFRRFLPEELDQPFTNKTLAQSLQHSVYLARRITYCLKKMGLIEEAGKKRNELLYRVRPL